MIAIQTPVAKQELTNLPANAFQNARANASATATPVAPKANYPFPCNTGIFGTAAKNYKPSEVR